MLGFHERSNVCLQNSRTCLEITHYLIQHQSVYVLKRYDAFQDLSTSNKRTQMCNMIIEAYTNLCNNSMNIPSLTFSARRKMCKCPGDESTVENSNAFFCQAMYRNHFWLHGTVLDHLSHDIYAGAHVSL